MNREAARFARFPLLTETPNGRLAKGLSQTIQLTNVPRTAQYPHSVGIVKEEPLNK
jgi:hypothetical protein